MDTLNDHLVTIGVVGGTGPTGMAAAARFASIGHSVVIGSRDEAKAIGAAESIQRKWPRMDLMLAGSTNETASRCDVVLLATAAGATLDLVSQLHDSLSDRVVITMANPVVRQESGDFVWKGEASMSLAERIQKEAPDARVVGALHHVAAKRLGAINRDLPVDVIVCSDWLDAEAQTAHILGRVPGMRVLRAGGLHAALGLEAFTAVLAQLAVRYGSPTSIRVLGP